MPKAKGRPLPQDPGECTVCGRRARSGGLCGLHQRRRTAGEPMVQPHDAIGITPSGHGLLGIVERDEIGVLCHECGRWMGGLSYHLSRVQIYPLGLAHHQKGCIVGVTRQGKRPSRTRKDKAMTSYTTKQDAIQAEIIDVIQASGVATADEYDIDAIADQVLTSEGTGFEYRIVVDETVDFWAVVEAAAK